MAKSTKLAAALGLAGAMLMPASACLAQQYLAPVAYGDCYYDITGRCASGSYAANGAYAAIAPVSFGSSYASTATVLSPVSVASTPWLWGRPRGSDLVAIHGATAP
jgi:hypothetical protein